MVTDVFFDLDHTLWDFEKNSALTFQKILNETQVKVDLDYFLKVYKPINLEFWKLYREEKISQEELRYQRLKQTFDTINYRLSPEQINNLSTLYIKNLSSFNHLLPNALDILNYLQPNYKLHIITNGFQEIQDKKLRNSNIYSFFDCIINSEMAGVKKPSPAIFQLALKKSNVSAEKALMIGDSLEADVLGAKAVGFHTVHFNAHNDPEHDICKIIKDLREIKFIL